MSSDRLEKHTVLCPHCGQPVLDHMTQCPHCGGELTPAGYQPMDETKLKKIKTITFIVGMVIAVAVLVLYFTLR